MKTKFFLSLGIGLAIFSCTQQKSWSPLGAWQIVQIQKVSGDTMTIIFPGELTGSDIILISERHLLSIGRFKKDSVFIDNYVGVSYTLEGNQFEETLLYYPDPARVGQKVRQIMELRNDTLIKKYPCDDNWELNKSGYTIERFVRLK